VTIDTTALLNAVASHAMALGAFERAGLHEPKGAPGQGLSVAFWVQSLTPLPMDSGMAETGVRLEITCRFYQPMLTEPQDAIDPKVMDAVDALFGAYHGDFQLGGLVRNIDLLGAFGTPLSAQAGYQTIDRTAYRVMTCVIPLVVNGAWEQVA
jgi:hypothetical protein